MTQNTTNQYRKKPVVIEARRLIGSSDEMYEVFQWAKDCSSAFDPDSDERPANGVSIDKETGYVLVSTLEGVMSAKPGDWIVKGVQGELYPCKHDVFLATYECVDGKPVPDGQPSICGYPTTTPDGTLVHCELTSHMSGLHMAIVRSESAPAPTTPYEPGQESEQVPDPTYHMHVWTVV